MCRIQKSFVVTEAERKHVRRRAVSRSRRELSSSFFLQGKAPNEIHTILTETLGEYATVKNWVAKFQRGDFSTCDAPRPGRPKTVTLGDY
jgi:transposase